MKKISSVAAALTVLLAFPAGASALDHPEHIQNDRGNGPALVENGEDRNNPGGSNGTIKLDGVEFDGSFDGHPNNEPHIGCRFEVDMYGFDAGDTAVLNFTEWKPTADMVPVLSVSTENIDRLGEDGAGGGVDIDDQQLVDLAPVLVGNPQPLHGHHVRLDAEVTSLDGSSYTKTKVFWTGICEDAEPPTSSY